jgi:hypothetical protein
MPNVTKTVSECAFHKHKTVCSSPITLNAMEQYLNDVKKDEEGYKSTSGLESISNSGPVDDKKKLKIIKDMKDTLKCNSESCILTNKNFVNYIGKSQAKHELEENFKPEGPALNTSLLSNFNIDDVLDQIHKDRPEFLHIPFQMIDFADYAPKQQDITKAKTDNEKLAIKSRNLATVDWNAEYKNGMRCAGAVLNTDHSKGPGIHWFAVFLDFRESTPTIEYFNSSGNFPVKEVDTWLSNTKQKIIDTMGFKRDDVHIIITSRSPIQNDQHSCGVYSLYYIINRVYGKPYTEIINNMSDNVMLEERKNLFRWHSL